MSMASTAEAAGRVGLSGGAGGAQGSHQTTSGYDFGSHPAYGLAELSKYISMAF